MGSLRGREVACSSSDLQGLNFESCVWRAVSSHSSHHPQEALPAQFRMYVHKSGIKPDSFHFYLVRDLLFFVLSWMRNFKVIKMQSNKNVINRNSSYHRSIYHHFYKFRLDFKYQLSVIAPRINVGKGNKLVISEEKNNSTSSNKF